jgi:L-alanine-DL-glutamate epimerase-like enolase superfamily enzyme
MKITNVRLSVLETDQPVRRFALIKLPGQHRERWLHAPQPPVGAGAGSSSGPTASRQHEFVLHVDTDAGITGHCTAIAEGVASLTRHDVDQLRGLVVGEDPLYREHLYQKLHQGTRWVYRVPGWSGAFDNCLWDIAGKAADLPVWALLGRVRDSAPAYLNIRGATVEEAADDARAAIDAGFVAVKDHFYHPFRENIEWLTAIREAVGPSIELMHDPVAVYTYDEAVTVGRALEGLGYRWFEEPLTEQFHNKLVQLAAELAIPIMSNETLMHEVEISAQWLISGATDLVRYNARTGVTPGLKLAHLAELHGANVEFNGNGGLWGLVHAHLICSVQNTSYYEYFPGGWHDEVGKTLGMMNPVVPENGRIRPPDTPGWGAEWDWDLFEKRTVEVWD